MSEWVSVKDKLPEKDGEHVLFLLDGSIYKRDGTENIYLPELFRIGWFRRRDPILHGRGLFGCPLAFDDTYYSIDQVDYWMPIPEEPISK